MYKIEPAEASGTQQRIMRMGWFSKTLKYYDENRDTSSGGAVEFVRGLDWRFVRMRNVG